MSRASMMGISSKTEQDYQADDDMRTLQRAEEIKRDPKRHDRAKTKAGEKLQHLAAIQAVPTAGKASK